MLPKKIRIIVLVNGRGAVTARTASEYRIQAHDLTIKGFAPLYSFNAPLRRAKSGWNKFYQYSIRRAVSLYGI